MQDGIFRSESWRNLDKPESTIQHGCHSLVISPTDSFVQPKTSYCVAFHTVTFLSAGTSWGRPSCLLDSNVMSFGAENSLRAKCLENNLEIADFVKQKHWQKRGGKAGKKNVSL